MTKELEPYRVFFPLGWLFGFGGVAIWLPWLLGLSNSYPGSIHPHIMIGGFLLVYATGFLTTAIPRFTGSATISRFEIGIATCLFLSLLMAAILQSSMLIHALDLAILLFLVVFARSRFATRSNNPPGSFIFVGLGILLGTFGAALHLLVDLGIVDGHYLPVARRIFFNDFMLSLVIGVGSRLIPALTGHQPVPQPQGVSTKGHAFRSGSLWSLVDLDLRWVFFVLLLSVILDFFSWNFPVPSVLRTAALGYIALFRWRILKWPQTRSFLSLFIWLSSWSIFAGQALSVVFPAWQVASLHLLLVSGFGLMTLMISTRVTLAHGGGPQGLAEKSTSLLLSGYLVVLASIFRWLGFMLGYPAFKPLLIAAATAWCLALTVWLYAFGRYWTKSAGKSHG